VAANTITDGQTLTLGDGVHTEIFELNRNAGCGSGTVCVNISGNATSVASSIATAINSEWTAGRLTITASASAGTVTMVNTVAGVAGNVGLATTVTAGAWSMTGMDGGLGFDCPSGTGCTSDADCASHTCLPGSGAVGSCQ
jgi:hypothetical protein